MSRSNFTMSKVSIGLSSISAIFCSTNFLFIELKHLLCSNFSFFFSGMCPDQLKELLDRQDELYQRQSELKALLESCESSSRRSPGKNDGSSDCSENWSGTFEWDSHADDIRFNVFGIPTYRANQREVGISSAISFLCISLGEKSALEALIN